MSLIRTIQIDQILGCESVEDRDGFVNVSLLSLFSSRQMWSVIVAICILRACCVHIRGSFAAFWKFNAESVLTVCKLLQAHKGYPEAMYRLGVFYYFGLRGVRRDHTKALAWLLKAVEKSDSRSMELLGEIYARGYGVERNYSQAYEWFLQAARQKHYAALNGIGYLYVKGQGVADGKNHTKVKVSLSAD